MEHYGFGRLTFTPETRELKGAGKQIELKPKNADVLHYLLRHRDRVITREEMFEAIWADTAVTDQALTKIITELRADLGDQARNSSFIRTIYKKGYRWIHESTRIVEPEDELPQVSIQVETPNPKIHSETRVIPIAGRFRKSLLIPALLIPVLGMALGTMLWPRPGAVPVMEGRIAQARVGEAPVVLGLLPFENQTGDQGKVWLEKGLQRQIGHLLESMEGVDLVPGSELEQVTRDLGSAPPDAQQAAAIHRNLAFDQLLSARISHRGEQWHLELAAVDPKGSLRRHQLSHPSLNHLASMAAVAAAGLAGIQTDKSRIPGSHRAGSDFITESYAKGIHYLEKDEVEKARNHFQVCLDNDPDFAWANFQLARCLRLANQREGSRMRFEKVRRQAERENNPVLQAEAIRYLGLLAQGESNWQQALDHCEQAIVLYRGMGLLRGVVAIQNQIAGVHARKGDPKKAEEILNRSLSMLPMVASQPLSATTLIRLSTIQAMQGELERAREEMERALELVRRLGDRGNEAALLNNLGNIAFLQRDHARAEPFFNQALTLWRELKRPADEVHTLVNLGIIRSLEQPARGLTNLEEALELARKVGDRYQETLAIMLMGANRIIAGENGHADELLTRAAHAAEQGEMKRLWCEAGAYRAILAVRDGNLDGADKLLAEVADVGAREPLYQVAYSLLAYERRNWQQALTHMDLARELSGQRWGESDQKLRDTYADALAGNRHIDLPQGYLPIF